MTESVQKIISARSARTTATLFNYGNIIAMLPGLFVVPTLMFGSAERMSTIFMVIAIVVPMILWFGISIMVYIFARHHPNGQVGYYTQQAAYRYYGVIGLIVVVGSFFGTNAMYWLMTWIGCALILVPWTVFDLFKIYQQQWHDATIEDTTL